MTMIALLEILAIIIVIYGASYIIQTVADLDSSIDEWVIVPTIFIIFIIALAMGLLLIVDCYTRTFPPKTPTTTQTEKTKTIQQQPEKNENN